MVRVLVIFTLIIAALTGVNVFIVSLLSSHPYLYLVLFLFNLITVAVASVLMKIPPEFKNQTKKNKSDTVAEESMSVFIKVIIYTLPIVALIGLYFISLMGAGSGLAIEDANSWVSFILGIAAFTMALITLWQSEWTYSKIFNALDQLKLDTKEIKTQNDMINAISKTGVNFNLNEELLGSKEEEGINAQSKPFTLKSPTPITQGEVHEEDDEQ